GVLRYGGPASPFRAARRGRGGPRGTARRDGPRKVRRRGPTGKGRPRRCASPIFSRAEGAFAGQEGTVGCLAGGRQSGASGRQPGAGDGTEAPAGAAVAPWGLREEGDLTGRGFGRSGPRRGSLGSLPDAWPGMHACGS